MDWDQFNHLVDLSTSGDEEKAITGLKMLIRPSDSAEDRASVWATVGACQRDVGRYDEARKSLQTARSLVDQSSWIYARCLFFEATVDVRLGDWSAALTRLDALLREHTAVLRDAQQQDLWEEVKRERGIVLYNLKRPKEARPFLEEAAALEYEKATTLYYLGRCSYDLGDLKAAQQALLSAVDSDLDPRLEPIARYVLGLSYHWLGQNGRAVAEFEWCLNHDSGERVQKWKVFTGLRDALTSLGMNGEADRYSTMLRDLQSH